MAITNRRTNTLTSRITSQGQITVPKAVRDQLGARAGDELEFQRRGDGFLLRHKPRRNILEFAGIAADAAARLPASAEELDAVIARGMSKQAVTHELRVRRHRSCSR